MRYLSLEEAKQGFEIGVKGNFLVSIGETHKTVPELKRLAREMNLIASLSKFSFVPVTSVSYLVRGIIFQELSFGGNTVSLPYMEKVPDELSLEFLDNNKEALEKGLLEWYNLTPMAKTGRISRDIEAYCLQVRVYHFDKPNSGESAEIVLNTKDVFNVTVSGELQKSNTQGASANSNSITLKVVGYKRTK